jgi:predicted Zn-ribbon and HTH transcriptional regulator
MAPVEEITRMKLTCTRCGHVWYPKGDKLPKTCANPKCKSPYWDQPYTERWLQIKKKEVHK